jgi:hypothetical protein
MIMLAGYHEASTRAQTSESDVLHRQRLFWQAYVMDQDLSIRLGKPPAIATDTIFAFPEGQPEDGVAVITLDDGSRLDYIREQVSLATIQRKIYSKLRALLHDKPSPDPMLTIMRELEGELQVWREGLPDTAKSQESLRDANYGRLMCLTCLHYTYFQLIIAIHTYVFRHPSLCDEPAWRSQYVHSADMCVTAARAAVSLLDYHDKHHPFTM